MNARCRSRASRSADAIGLGDSPGECLVIERPTGQVLQSGSDALQLRLRRIRSGSRGAEKPPGKCHGLFSGLGVPPVRDLPPEDRVAQAVEPLGDGGEIVARRADAARQQIGNGEMRLGDERPEHRAHRAERLVDAERIGDLEQSGVHAPSRRESTTRRRDRTPRDCRGCTPSRARCPGPSSCRRASCRCRGRRGAGPPRSAGSSTVAGPPASCRSAASAAGCRRRPRAGRADRRRRAAVMPAARRRSYSAVPLLQS